MKCAAFVLMWIARLVALAAVCSLSVPAAAGQKLVTHEHLTAYLPDGFVCSETADVLVLGGSADDFEGDRIEIQKLIGAIPFILSLTCPEIQALTISGEADGQRIFAGSASKGQNWVLEVEESKGAATATGGVVEDAIDEVTTQLPQKPSLSNDDTQLTLAVQKQLNRLGYQISADGVYGSGTRGAIIDFERSSNMNATGNVSRELLDRLELSALSEAQAAKQEPIDQSATQTTQETFTDNIFKNTETGVYSLAKESDRGDKYNFSFWPQSSRFGYTSTTKRKSMGVEEIKRRQYSYFDGQQSVLIRVGTDNIILPVLGNCRPYICFSRFDGGDAQILIDLIVSGGFFEFKVEGAGILDATDWIRFDIPAVQDAAEPKLPAPVVAAITLEPAGPVYQACKMRGIPTTLYFDCACMEQRASEYKMRAITGAGDVNESIKGLQFWIGRAEGSLADRKKNYQGSDKQRLIEMEEKNIADLRQQIWVLENPSSVTDVKPDKIVNVITEAGACKNTSELETYRTQECTGWAQNVPKNKTAEAYCGCVGKSAVTIWHDFSGPLDSRSIVAMGSEAFASCR